VSPAYCDASFDLRSRAGSVTLIVMSDTDSHDPSDFAARQEAAAGRALATPRRRFQGTPPVQRDGGNPAPPDLYASPRDLPDQDKPNRDKPNRGKPDQDKPNQDKPNRGRWLGQAASLHAVGSPARRRVNPNVGLFDIGTITWHLHGDPLMGVAGLRALLLHALHPVAMAAVDAHNPDQWDPWLRLSRTAEYVGVTTYGTAGEAMLAGSRLRAVHARIYGTTRQGRPYAAEDPHLLAWVHACLVASFLEIVTRGGLSLTPQQQDEYIGEQVRAAMLVGLEPEEVPHDRASLVASFRRIRPALAVTPQAQAAAMSVVYGEQPHRRPGPPVPDRPVWSSVAGLAFATLPPWARRLYALPQLPGAAGLSESAATVALRALRTSLKSAQSRGGGAAGPGERP
jgi:uncharacterized protein (DUF2236 family)